jgi:hypothetical protein
LPSAEFIEVGAKRSGAPARVPVRKDGSSASRRQGIFEWENYGRTGLEKRHIARKAVANQRPEPAVYPRVRVGRRAAQKLPNSILSV